MTDFVSPRKTHPFFADLLVGKVVADEDFQLIAIDRRDAFWNHPARLPFDADDPANLGKIYREGQVALLLSDFTEDRIDRRM